MDLDARFESVIFALGYEIAARESGLEASPPFGLPGDTAVLRAWLSRLQSPQSAPDTLAVLHDALTTLFAAWRLTEDGWRAQQCAACHAPLSTMAPQQWIGERYCSACVAADLATD